MALTHNLGFPRIGDRRQLKRVTERYWSGDASQDELHDTAAAIRARNWQHQARSGIDVIPSNDFSFYDQVLDTSAMVGNIPERFGWRGGPVDLDTRFAVARGTATSPASEMTKWFDTNYHYIVPELTAATEFELVCTKVLDEHDEARRLGIATVPVLVGPYSYLALGKTADGSDPMDLVDRLVPVYATVLRLLAERGCEWVQIDEPCLVLDLPPGHDARLRSIYRTLAAPDARPKLMLATYFGPLLDNAPLALELSVDGLHIDTTRGADDIEALIAGFPNDRTLSLGVVDGRNIWRTRYDRAAALIRRCRERLEPDRLWVSASCSLMHVPLSVTAEGEMDPTLTPLLAFAEEKLDELRDLKALADGELPEAAMERNRALFQERRPDAANSPSVRARTRQLSDADFERRSRFETRAKALRDRLSLPRFPTTTIGSFPQTAEVRRARAGFRSGKLAPADYERFLAAEIERCVRFQEAAGLDLLVHGEFERNDMVEYFGERLHGFAATRHGWVQSYGTRYVKPPIIYGDVRRDEPMTLAWSAYAASLTDKPVKGMLTGPVTIMQWSFVRDDQPRPETAAQIALAIRDEVMDLERAGMAAIQVDEPALREGLPLRTRDKAAYLEWAVSAFRLATSGVRDDTQIHTHMCYSEFNDIIDAIIAMDADVITIEAARSSMEVLEAFAQVSYPNEIGPGVYDIHSPRVPSQQEMRELADRAAAVIEPSRLWINPDCGLKTRRWEEVDDPLRNMVAAARALRRQAG